MKVILAPLLFLTLTLGVCQKQEVYQSENLTSVKIDGNSEEWKNKFTYDKNSKFLYSIANDSNNLFVCLKVMEKELQRKILMQGLTAWIDTTGKYKQRTGIMFPIGVMEKGSPRPTEKQDSKPGIKNLLADNTFNEIEIKGFYITKNYGNEFIRIASGSKAGICTSINIDTLEYLIYELKIPLRILSESKSSTDGKIWGISFITPNENPSAMPQGGGAPMGGGGGLMPGAGTMGGGGGGAMGGGGSRQGMPNNGMQRTGFDPSPTVLKIKVRLN